MARAFPGLFRYRDFFEMDWREMEFWLGKACEVLAQTQRTAINVACAPYMEAAERNRWISALKDMERGPGSSKADQEAQWARNRADLALMFGRKGK